MMKLRDVWTQGFALVRQNWPIALAVVAILSGVATWADLAGQGSLASALSISWLLVTHQLLKFILDGTWMTPKSGKSDLTPSWSFFWRGLVLTLTPIAVGVAILVSLPDNSEFARHQGLLLYFLTVVVTTWLTFAIAGTWLPATIEGQNPSLSTALLRGRKTFWRSLYLIVLGPTVVIFAGYVLTFGFLASSAGWGLPSWLSDITATGINNLFSFAGIVMLTIILCDAYRVGEQHLTPMRA